MTNNETKTELNEMESLLGEMKSLMNNDGIWYESVLDFEASMKGDAETRADGIYSAKKAIRDFKAQVKYEASPEYKAMRAEIEQERAEREARQAEQQEKSNKRLDEFHKRRKELKEQTEEIYIGHLRRQVERRTEEHPEQEAILAEFDNHLQNPDLRERAATLGKDLILNKTDFPEGNDIFTYNEPLQISDSSEPEEYEETEESESLPQTKFDMVCEFSCQLDEYMTAQQIAEAVGCSVSTVYRSMKAEWEGMREWKKYLRAS